MEIRRGPRGQAERMETDDSELHAKVQKSHTYDLHHHLDNEHSQTSSCKGEKPHTHYFHHDDLSRHQRSRSQYPESTRITTTHITYPLWSPL